MKKFIRVISKILLLFVNPFTADNKYSLHNRDNLQPYFPMQLSQKGKMFSKFFFSFSKSRHNFEKFQKTDDPHSWCIGELTDLEPRG